MAAYQQFLKHIYWNFMESSISGIGIWLNLWVIASEELGKPYFWQNLFAIDQIRYAKSEFVLARIHVVDTNGHKSEFVLARIRASC